MNTNKKIKGLEMTKEEFLVAYKAADAETQAKIRRLLGLEK